MLAWKEHTCNTPKRGSQQTQLRTVEGLAFGPGVLTPNPQQAGKQERERDSERERESWGGLWCPMEESERQRQNVASARDWRSVCKRGFGTGSANCPHSDFA